MFLVLYYVTPWLYIRFSRFPVRKGGTGVVNPWNKAPYSASRKITAPLAEQIKLQLHGLPDNKNTCLKARCTQREE